MKTPNYNLIIFGFTTFMALVRSFYFANGIHKGKKEEVVVMFCAASVSSFVLRTAHWLV